MIKQEDLVAEITRRRTKFASWQFGQLAVFFFLLLLLLPVLKHPVLMRSITTLFVLNILLVADSSSPNARAMRYIGWTLWTIAALSNAVEVFHLNDALTFATRNIAVVAHALLFLTCAATILGVVFRAGRITLDGILASIVAYQLIGLFFAQIYTSIILINPAALHLPDSIAPSTETFQLEMIYFSFVTLATLGYGDILPATSFARSVTILEAIVGQFYVAVIVAFLVSAFVSQRLEAARPPGESN